MPIRARDVLLAVAAAGMVTGAGEVCRAQSKVEFRIVERAGQVSTWPGNPVMHFAVQGRVADPGTQVGIGGFAFAIILNGEAPSAGVLAPDPISLSDGTYFGGLSAPPPGTVSGVARHYRYLVGLDPSFNGLINASGGGWTQSPSADIGLITGASSGLYLLGTPGVDVDENGTPDTAIGNEATLPAPIMSSYFGAGNTWIDLYRFRYTVTSFASRTLDLHLVSTTSDPDPTAFTFTKLERANGSWGMVSTPVSVDSSAVEGLKLSVVPSPGALSIVLCCAVLTSTGSHRRRRRGSNVHTR